MDENEGLM